jgi:hypothetical protein
MDSLATVGSQDFLNFFIYNFQAELIAILFLQRERALNSSLTSMKS